MIGSDSSSVLFDMRFQVQFIGVALVGLFSSYPVTFLCHNCRYYIQHINSRITYHAFARSLYTFYTFSVV